MKIAINGMGRIGRLLFRRLINAGIDVVAVNDLMDPQNLAYLIKYDSIYGRTNFDIRYSNKLWVGKQQIECFNEPEPSNLPWKQLDVDVVLECSGRFTTLEKASQHLAAGAKKILLSTTGSTDIPLVIYGYNHEQLQPGINILSPGGCMTNCTTAILNMLSPFGIESVQINIIHSFTSRQELVDAPHTDFRRGRAAAESIIPVPVDLAESLERLFPELSGKISAVTTRVPVANGALADITLTLSNKLSVPEINNQFRHLAEKSAGVIQYTEDPIVSADIRGNTHSAIIDGSLTSAVGNSIKTFAFFDNEWGYTSRMLDLLMFWHK